MPNPAAPTPARLRLSNSGAFGRIVLIASLGWLTGWAQGEFDLEKVRARAEQADTDAQNTLGNAYNEGRAGLKQDYTEALKWYRRAAERGFAQAQYNLGLAHELGHGVPADEREAFKSYLQAAEQGFGPAQYNVGNMYATGRGIGQDLFEANLWFKQAAEKGIVEAQFNLGLAYEAGRGVRKDETQAARWYKQAADRGFSRAQYNLGLLLEDGRGVPKNEAAAAGYYRAAAEQGFAAAQNNYGLMWVEGRGGLAKDPAQAWVWLSLAVENGTNPAARDTVAQGMSSEQRTSAAQLLADRRAGKVPTPTVTATLTAPGKAPPTPRAPELNAVLEETREANAQLAEANQRLEVDKARLEQQLAQGGAPASLVEQLRAQSSRLAAQVQALTADKEAAGREVALLNLQVRDAQQEAARAKTAGTAPAVDNSRAEKEVADLTTKLMQANETLARLEAANRQLTEGNTRLQQELAAKSGNPASPGATGDQAAILATLQRDNARLNDEVKRSTRELLSLNSQLRVLRNQPANPATPDKADAGQIAQLSAKLEQAAQATTQWQQQVATLQAEKADLEKWSRSLEQTVNEKSTQSAGAGVELADLRQKFDQAQGQLEIATQEARSLTTRLAQAEQARAALPDPAELSAARQQLAEARQAAEKSAQGTQALTDKAAEDQRSLSQAQTRIAGLERELRTARESVGQAEESAELKKQLAAVNQALEKSGATVAELTDTNDRLETELTAARATSTETAAGREELAKAKAEVVALRQKNEQLARDGEQLSAFMDGNRRDLNQAQARVGELEKQLATATQAQADKAAENQRSLGQAQTRIAGLERELHAARENTGQAEESADLRKQLAAVNQALEKSGATVAELTGANDRLEKDLTAARATKAETGVDREELAKANASVEKLNATVAELTAANDRLEQDLDSARKGTAAALAAQSQAVSAAQPEAYKMEISTLQAQVKGLESQIEDERNNSAKEISSLAAQLSRTRETNKSLTEANRALLSARPPESEAADKAELAKLQGTIRDLTAAVGELRQQNEKLTDYRLTQLGEATDEKAVLQKQLETVGEQLGKVRLEAEQARGELTAMQNRVAEAEKATGAQSTSVAELTQANTRMEQEREDMRRLVESYRADIARLTLNVRGAEQQRAEAERGAQQNIGNITAQLAQLQRDLEGARANHARLAEAGSQQDRERLAIITQLRTENGALAARLNQAQSTLDQIASAARLGTPASVIAAGGTVPTRSVPTAPLANEARFHTVASGDSLSRISMRYYGTANRWQEIYNANSDVLQGSSTLRVGMQLRIP